MQLEQLNQKVQRTILERSASRSRSRGHSVEASGYVPLERSSSPSLARPEIEYKTAPVGRLSQTVADTERQEAEWVLKSAEERESAESRRSADSGVASPETMRLAQQKGLKAALAASRNAQQTRGSSGGHAEGGRSRVMEQALTLTSTRSRRDLADVQRQRARGAI